MSSVKAIYPNGILSWTDRIDDVNIVFAIDPNTLAAEINSIETVVGTNPQIEKSTPAGGTMAYSTVDARISDAMNNALMPVVSVQASRFSCSNSSERFLNTYTPHYDPHNMFNGTDITVSASGWWVVTTKQTWDWWDVGYSHHCMCLNGLGNILVDHIVDWEFPGNTVFGGIPGRWQLFGRRQITSYTTWQGLLNEGDRLSGSSENGTTNPTQNVFDLEIKACMVRSISGQFPSG